MGRYIDLTGQKFNRLTVIGKSTEKSGERYKIICQCDCGKIMTVVANSIKNGHTKSCGCLNIEVYNTFHVTHGAYRTSEYKIWQAMKSRCYNTKTKRYIDYGGKGITVCDRWLKSFENFFEDMGKKPTPKHSIDRYPNYNGNYEKSNCRWATYAEQSRNLKKNIWIEHEGKKMVAKDWAILLGIDSRRIYEKIKIMPFKEIFDYHTSKNNIQCQTL